jgi:hypothetical protein
VPLGFTFNFYGTSYTSVFASSNGLITFGSGNLSFANDNLTTAAAPTQNVPNDLPLIAPLWDDWSTDASGADAVYYQTLGSAPSRRLVIEWHITSGCCAVTPPAADFVTFQAILYEGSGNILVQYLDTTTTNTYNHGNTATVGIRDVNGQSNGRNLQWSFNSSVINDSTTVLFTPSCGNGAVNAGEQCDEGVDNGTTTSCCTAGCQFRAGGETCRVSAGVCDPTEMCTGSTRAVSGRRQEHVAVPCLCRRLRPRRSLRRRQRRLSGGCQEHGGLPWDGGRLRRRRSVRRAERHLSGGRQEHVHLPRLRRLLRRDRDLRRRQRRLPGRRQEHGRVPRLGGVCDVAESCDGINNACPADAKSSAECRASGGVCDIAESCDGVNNACRRTPRARRRAAPRPRSAT